MGVCQKQVEPLPVVGFTLASFNDEVELMMKAGGCLMMKERGMMGGGGVMMRGAIMNPPSEILKMADCFWLIFQGRHRPFSQSLSSGSYLSNGRTIVSGQTKSGSASFLGPSNGTNNIAGGHRPRRQRPAQGTRAEGSGSTPGPKAPLKPEVQPMDSSLVGKGFPASFFSEATGLLRTTPSFREY